jgi:methionyl-tRNA formyltransferase
MRVAIIGRTQALLSTADRLTAAGHEVALVVSARPSPEYTRTLEDFQAYAASAGAAFLASPRAEDMLPVVEQMPAIDIGVSVNFPGIIPQTVIDRFRCGILNAHGGDLPRYRGNACQAWAILNGEPQVGLCIHRMVGGELDTGDIVAREYLAIDLRTTVTEVVAWMESRTPHLFEKALNHLFADPAFCLARQSADPADALRCYPRRPEDGRIDWRRPAEDVLRLINASTRPYAGAYCELEGRRLIVWSAELVDDGERFMAVPGQVTRAGEGMVDVATGRGKVRLRQVEMDGGEVPVSQLIRSIRQRLT